MMAFSFLKSVSRWVVAFFAGPATPLVLAGAGPLARPVILECAFIEVPIAAYDGTTVSPADHPVTTPRAEEAGERPEIVAIGAQAAAFSATSRREPEDHMLAQRLRSVAVLNRPRSASSGRKPVAEAPRRRGAGPLSPVLARARSFDRVAIAA